MNLRSEEVGEKETPTISIYQNSEHVAGLVQQLFNAPLVTEQLHEGYEDKSRKNSFEVQADGEITASLKVPLAGGVSAAGELAGAGGRSKVVATGSKTTQSFVYSQAYYLNTVRRSLRALGHLKSLTSSSEASSLNAGDFVEYQAVFAPSELTTITDVLTPEMVAEVVSYVVKRPKLMQLANLDSIEAVQIAGLQMQEAAVSAAGLAREITKAVKADFRQNKTREYYGHVGTGADRATAITICDNNHFVVNDEDRILDGTYTVLGKVTSGAEVDVPVLKRNKLLRNFSPDGVDGLFEQLRSVFADDANAKVGSMAISELLDLQLASRIHGVSIRVVPLAIYV